MHNANPTGFQNSRMSLPQSLTPRTRQSSASSSVSTRKSIGGFRKPTGGSSRYSVSGRSVTSNQIITRSENNVAQSFGLPLPIVVNEALTFSERNTAVSISCSENGWAWAVTGRKLLVWQYKESKVGSPKFDAPRTPQRRNVTGQCRELTLPHSDIGHKASLISVFLTEGLQMASCLAVSPTGDVRYWPSIAHDGSSIDESGILEGQEFDELLSISPLGYVLVTTTCNLVLMQLQLQSGRHSIVHRAVRPPSGFLGGFGKRFASIIIGSSGQDRENKFVKACAERKGAVDWDVSILSDKWIQRWIVSPNASETFLFEDTEIIRKIKEAFQEHIWQGRDPNEIEQYLLDMQITESTLTVLAAAVNINHTPQLYYALITLVESGTCYKVKSFCQMKHQTFYSGDSNDENLKMKFIYNRSIGYVYADRTIHEIILNGVQISGDNTEKIEFPVQGDKILAATIYNQIPLFFTRIHGLVSLSASDFDNSEFFNNTLTAETHDASFLSQTLQTQTDNAMHLTVYDINPDEVYNLNDIVSKIKAAFIYHLKKQPQKCSAVLNELFADEKLNVHDELDNIITKIAKDLAEDIPAADPRWEEQASSNCYALGSSASMQIIQQLKEKNRAYIHFVEFLHATELWDRLSTVTEKGAIKPTCHVLSDINEKIIAAIALKGIHNNYSTLIDDAIENVLRMRNESAIGNLTSQDLFYVKVTRVQELIKVFSNLGDEQIQNKQGNSGLSSSLLDIGTIILTVINEVMKFREAKKSLYTVPDKKGQQLEYVPWTAAPGKNGLRDVLLHLVTIILKYGARSTGEPELRQRHYKNLVEMIDFVLSSRRSFLESIKDSEKHDVLWQQYETQRSALIYNFVEDDQYDLAIKLAEKYLDFQTLVLICDRTSNQTRLDEYIERFKEHDFSQFAINWHLQQNKRGDLFERFKRNQSDLSRFLGDHPSLAWVQAVFNGNLLKAAHTLTSLAQNETELVARKKTILSLAKLACLAADEDLSEQIIQINNDLLIIEYQSQIPTRMLSVFGYDTDNPRVLRAEEIINLLVAVEHEEANEYDFQKALALVPFTEDPADVNHKIWCSAVLRNSWDSYNINAPQDTLQNLLFFKLVDQCFFMDADLKELLPPLNQLLDAPELGSITASKSFQFLLKLGYEHIKEAYCMK